jgi:hypothetical protein
MKRQYVIANRLPETIFVVPGRGVGVDVEFTLFSQRPRNLLRKYFALHPDEYLVHYQPVESVSITSKLGRKFHSKTIENDKRVVFILEYFLTGNN